MCVRRRATKSPYSDPVTEEFPIIFSVSQGDLTYGSAEEVVELKDLDENDDADEFPKEN